MFRRLFPGSSVPPKSPAGASRGKPGRARLLVEWLEEREVPAVLLRPWPQAIEGTIPNDKPVYLPVTVTNTPSGAVNVTVSSSNPAGVAATVVQGGQSVQFEVAGKDASGADFSGTLTIRLFPESAPQTVQRIIELVQAGFYTDKVFHRVINNFMIQGGSPDGSGSGGSPLPDVVDEFNRDFTFASNGVVAMANATDDNNDSQFFITDVDQVLSQREQHLNFNHNIVGILTDGFELYQKIITLPVSGDRPTNPPVIKSARVFDDTENAVIKLTPASGFTGAANITVTATDADGAAGQATQSLSVTPVDDNVNSRPFIPSPIPDQVTTTGTPVSFTIPAFDAEGDALAYDIRAATPTGTPSGFFTGLPTGFTFSINQQTGVATLTPNPGFTGTTEFRVGVRQASAGTTADNFDTQLVRLTVNPPEATNPQPDPEPEPDPNTGPFTAEGSAPGLEPAVIIRNEDGSVRFTVPVFDSNFRGGVRVAVGDVTGDDQLDVVAVPGFGGGPIIHVIDPTTGTLARTITVFDAEFRGGLTLNVADGANRGYDQIIVGAGDTGGPRVTVLDIVRNETLWNFFAADENFRGGVSVDLGPVFSSREAMIVTGTGPGTTPTVSVFSFSHGLLVGSFAADGFDANVGIRVRIGEVDSQTGVAPIFVAPLTSADGQGEKRFDPSQFMNPQTDGLPKPPTTTTPPSTSPGFDLSDLLPR